MVVSDTTAITSLLKIGEAELLRTLFKDLAENNFPELYLRTEVI